MDDFTDMNVAHFPISGPRIFPQREDYLREAELLQRNGRWWTGYNFKRVARRLSWTPKYLATMKREDAA